MSYHFIPKLLRRSGGSTGGPSLADVGPPGRRAHENGIRSHLNQCCTVFRFSGCITSEWMSVLDDWLRESSSFQCVFHPFISSLSSVLLLELRTSSRQLSILINFLHMCNTLLVVCLGNESLIVTKTPFQRIQIQYTSSSCFYHFLNKIAYPKYVILVQIIFEFNNIS